MPRFCENCGTELSENTLFCPSCGKAQANTPAAVLVQKGPLALPRNGLSLAAVILVLLGSIFSNGNWVLTVSQGHVNVFWTLEVVLTFAAAVVLFVGHFTRMQLKIPMLVWGGAALIGLVSDLNTAFKMWALKHIGTELGIYYFFLGLLTAASALFIILYAFKAIKKIPAAVILGVLLTALIILGVSFNLKNLAGYLSVYNKNIPLIARTLYSTLYSFIFPVGIFLTALSAKEKVKK